MAGLKLIIPAPGPGLAPPLPAPLDPTGVDDAYEYIHRYDSHDLSALADGTNISSINDYGLRSDDMAPLFTGGSGGTLKKQHDSTNNLDYFEIIASAGSSGRGIGGAGSSYDADICVAMAVRRVDVSQRLFQSSGMRVDIQADGTLTLSRNGASATGPSFGANAWAFVLCQLSGTNWVMRVNGTETTGTLGSATTATGGVGMGGNVGLAASKTVHFARRVDWAHAMDSTERAAIRAAMKSSFPVLP